MLAGNKEEKRTPGLKSELLTLVEQTPELLAALALGCFGFYDICDIYHLLKNVQFVMISLLILKKCSLLYIILYLSFCILRYISFWLPRLGSSPARTHVHVTESSIRGFLLSHLLGSKNSFGRDELFQ